MDENRQEELNKIRASMGLPPIGFTPKSEKDPVGAAASKRVVKREAGEPMIAPEHIETLERWWALESPAEGGGEGQVAA